MAIDHRGTGPYRWEGWRGAALLENRRCHCSTALGRIITINAGHLRQARGGLPDWEDHRSHRARACIILQAITQPSWWMAGLWSHRVLCQAQVNKQLIAPPQAKYRTVPTVYTAPVLSEEVSSVSLKKPA